MSLTTLGSPPRGPPSSPAPPQKSFSRLASGTEERKVCYEPFSVEELLHNLSKDSTPESVTPKAGAASAVKKNSPNSNDNNSSNNSSSSSNSSFVLYKGVPLRPSQVSMLGRGAVDVLQPLYALMWCIQTAGPPWDIEGILGLRPEGTQSGKPAQGAARTTHAGKHFQAAEALSSKDFTAEVEEQSGAPQQRGPRAEQAAQVRHELLLLRRRMQCESAALQAQHEAKVAEERAAWENEKQRLLFKTQTLQATVDQTLARYEEDVKLLGQARGSVLQQQQLEQQQQQQQLQLQLRQALQAERDHWSARLQAANDEWRRRLEDDRRAAEAKLQQVQQARESPAWHELHALILESKRSSDEFKQLVKGFQFQQQQQQLMQKRGGAEGDVITLPCEACGRLADIHSAVAALQQQQQTLLLVAEETAKLREETEQRTKAASSKLTEQSLQLQGLHRSLLASRQQQQQLQQQQQQQLQQQQHFLEQQQQAFSHRQLEAEADATSQRTQELAETAMALEEKRRALRCCFEEIEAQRIAVEGRAARASAEAQSAAAEAQKARTLQQENVQAKEVLQQLRRRAKNAEKQQQEQQDVIKCLVKEVESSKLELLRMQQSQSLEVYMNRLSGMLLPYSRRSLILGPPKPQPPLCGSIGLGPLQWSTASSFIEMQKIDRQQAKASDSLEKQASCTLPQSVYTQPPPPQAGSTTFVKPSLQRGGSLVEQVWQDHKYGQQQRQQQDLVFCLTKDDAKRQAELLLLLLLLLRHI
ncbi:hypothetical protein ACSSS7_000510 [Eimeria intestinalis]